MASLSGFGPGISASRANWIDVHPLHGSRGCRAASEAESVLWGLVLPPRMGRSPRPYPYPFSRTYQASQGGPRHPGCFPQTWTVEVTLRDCFSVNQVPLSSLHMPGGGRTTQEVSQA